MSASTLGAVKYRSVREQKAHAARVDAKANKMAARAARDTANNAISAADAWDAGFAAGYQAATNPGASAQNPHR